jgi:cold shock CspA family protein
MNNNNNEVPIPVGCVGEVDYVDSRGFGFLYVINPVFAQLAGYRVYFHKSDVEGNAKLNPGDKVCFTLVANNHAKYKFRAIDVRRLTINDVLGSRVGSSDDSKSTTVPGESL